MNVGNQFGRIVDFFAVHLRDDVAALQSGAGGWTFRSHVGNFRTLAGLSILCIVRRVLSIRVWLRLCLALPLRSVLPLWNVWIALTVLISAIRGVVGVGSYFLEKNAQPSVVAFRRLRHEFKRRLSAIALDNQRHRPADLGTQIRLKVACLAERTAIRRDHVIVGLQSGLCGGGIRIHALHVEPVLSLARSLEFRADRVLIRGSLTRLLANLLGRLLTGLLTRWLC